MGILDLFRKNNQSVVPNSNVFSFLFGRAAPDYKTDEYKTAYKGWVYSCVNAISEDIGAIELSLQMLTRDGWSNFDDHLAIQTLRSANPHDTFSDIMTATQSFLELAGEVFWWTPRGKQTNKPAQIYVLDPGRIQVVKSLTEYIGGYVYRAESGEEVPLKTEEVMHFKRFNPFNRYRGMGTVRAAALAIDIDTYSAEWNRNFFYNSAMPNATLETEGTLNKEQMDLIRSQWEARYQGRDNAHKIGILQGGLKFNPISLSPKDMDFLEQRRYSRDEILGIFRVPKSILGIVEDVNRANAEASEYTFAKRTVKPRMRFIVDRLNEFYLPMFNLDQSKFKFTFKDPVPENADLQIRKNESGIKNGYYTINEIRESEGKEPVKGGDEIYLPFNLMPIGELATQKPSDATQTNSLKTKLIKKKFNRESKKRNRYVSSAIKKCQPDYVDLMTKFGSIVKANIASEEGKSIKGVTQKGKVDKLLAIALRKVDKEWKVEVENVTEKVLKDSFLYAGMTELMDLGIESAFDLKNPRAVEWIKNRLFNDLTSISDTLKDDVRNILVSGLENGDSYQIMAGAIGQFFDENSDYKAERIARTEVHSSYCGGRIEADRQCGLKLEKGWITMDGGCCDSCRDNEAQGFIPLDSDFQSGDDTPSAHPNCRCDYHTRTLEE